MHRESKLKIYPQPAYAEKHNAGYSLKVRPLGENSWQDLPVYAVKVDMHDPREAGMATFDFEGVVEIEMIYDKFQPIYQAAIHPLSLGIEPKFEGSRLSFTLEEANDLAVVVNNERFHNLHLFANPIEEAPAKDNENVLVIKGDLERYSILPESNYLNEQIAQLGPNPLVYFEAGYHSMCEFIWQIPSGTTVYFEGGAVFRGSLIIEDAEQVTIFGRGIIDQKTFGQISGTRGMRLQRAQNVAVHDLIMINPGHYTVYVGQSTKILLENIRSFSCEGWTDGIDMMSSQDITVSGGFLRTSDDCIAVYGSRWQNCGDTRNVLIEGITLWADVAHPMMIGTHGDHEHNGDRIENLVFRNIDIIDQHELQDNYLGVMAIAPGDMNLVRNIQFENIRVEGMSHGRLFDFRVKHNSDYNPSPGRGVEDVTVKDIFVTSSKGEEVSLVAGFDEVRRVKNIRFENIVRDGKKVNDFAAANIVVGEFTTDVSIK